MYEATSELDSVTEQYIQDSFKELMVDSTTLVIVHKLSKLLCMDRMLIFDKAVIFEEEAPKQLVEQNSL
jgi:ABC-type multidrug transport system fused ATPase/permease subunit